MSTSTKSGRAGRASRLAGVGVAALSAIILSACAGGSGGSGGSTGAADTSSIAAIAAKADPHAPEATTIRGALWQGPISAQWFLGADVAEQDYGVTFSSDWMTDATVGRAQLAAGEIDIVPGSTIGAVQLSQGGVDTLIVAGNYTSQPGEQLVYAMPGSGITSVADLAGKTIAMTALTGSHPNRLRLEIKDAGGDPASLNIVASTYADMPAQLQSGVVDAVSVAAFAIPAVEAVGAVKVFDLGAGKYSGRPENVWLTTKKFYEANPNTIAAFQCAVAEGGKLANDRANMEKFMADVLGYKPAVIAVSQSPISVEGPLSEQQIQADWDDDVAINGDAPFDVSSLVIPYPPSC